MIIKIRINPNEENEKNKKQKWQNKIIIKFRLKSKKSEYLTRIDRIIHSYNSQIHMKFIHNLKKSVSSIKEIVNPRFH